MPIAHEFHQGVIRGRAGRFVAGDHLHLAPAQTGGDLQAVETGDPPLGLPQGVGQPGLGESEHSHRLLSILGAPGDGLLYGVGRDRGQPHRLQLFGWAGKHHHRRGTRDDRPGCGADRLQNGRADRNHGLLAIGFAERVHIGVRESGHPFVDDLADRRFQRLVEYEFAATEAGDGLDCHIVGGGSEAAGRDDEVDSLSLQEAQLCLDIGGTVTADGDVGQFDPQFQQTVGHPGAVAIGDAAGEDFGTGDQDSCPCAH